MFHKWKMKTQLNYWTHVFQKRMVQKYKNIENTYMVYMNEDNILLKATLILINIDGIYACYIISEVLYILQE